MKKKAVILGFYVSAALINAGLAVQYAFGGVISSIVLCSLIAHFIVQIVHGYYEQTVPQKYGIGLGVAAVIGLVVADLFASLALRAFIKLYMVYLSVSRKHLDNTVMWPAKWVWISALTIGLIFGSALVRLLHWPGAVEMVFAGYAIRSLFFIYIGYYKAFTAVELEDEVDEIGKG